ncbi:TetR/AcrR family transcriptional regulator [Sphingomonas colocasiae]|uniref:TetR/AcrR family transcriptional regulator n=1 Tax=Sphingomonas colocasiae TaxID=1848973 RepID=A0ABS7PHQ4_9SPHN|nr:TetR/AcrR family transcriptional regulator [Sphingomonas colocasiae]MBY8820823.1 TetR/AcrR family transcriptional regulator [Sphingomonas colocasiae]
MGRRSDHSREELRDMIISEGHRQLAETGYARFSAREVAKRIGYSIGTVYNVLGSHDQLMLAINGLTLDRWQGHLEARLSAETENRLHRAIQAYFEFAILNRNLWTALYDFRLPEGEEMPDYYQQKVRDITQIVIAEIATVLPPAHADRAAPLARSLLACVHGHCFFTLNGTFRLLGETDPLEAAYARVTDAIAACSD